MSNLYIIILFETRPQFQLGFLFFVDDKKIKESSELNRSELIKSEIKEGLIKMGNNYDWDKETVDGLFQKIDC